MATTTTNSFDFDEYNKVMANANSGLKLFLAERLLQDVQEVMVRFKSPLRKDIDSIVDEVGQLRADNKKYLASREKSSSGEIDNAGAESPKSTSADGGKVSGTEAPLPEASA
jgi:hypothetical protein